MSDESGSRSGSAVKSIEQLERERRERMAALHRLKVPDAVMNRTALLTRMQHRIAFERRAGPVLGIGVGILVLISTGVSHGFSVFAFAYAGLTGWAVNYGISAHADQVEWQIHLLEQTTPQAAVAAKTA